MEHLGYCLVLHFMPLSPTIPTAIPTNPVLGPVRREQLLAQAIATRSIEPVAQRNAVNKLIFESVLSRDCTSVEILEAAYQDPQGRRYWELWLYEPLPIYQFAELLALGTPAAKEAAALDCYLFQIFERLRAAAQAGETWFKGDTSPLIAEPWSSLALQDSTLCVRPREAIAWMYQNPNARHLVPPRLVEIVELFAEQAILPPASPAATAGMDPSQRTRRGPQRGTVDRFGEADRALFPQMKRLVEKAHKSAHAAALELASAGKIKGAGTEKSRAQRLAKRFRKDRAAAITR